MSKSLFPWQITGNLAKNAHEMLYMKKNLDMASGSVFGETYFDL